MYKFHKSHLFVFGLVIYASTLIIKYGLDHTSYWGREIPFVILAISVFLIVIDHISEDFKDSDGFPSWIMGVVIPLIIIGIVILVLDKITDIREKSALRNSAFTTAEIIGYSLKFDFGEFDHAGTDHSDEKSFHVYYKYLVNGIEYKQSNKLHLTMGQVISTKTKQFPYKKGSKIDIKYSQNNPIVSKIVNHQN